MRRKLSICLLLLLLICLCAAPAARAEGNFSYVEDSAGILSQEEEQALEERARAISEACRCSVYIVTVQDYRTMNPSGVGECAEGIYSFYDLGYGSGRDGLLLLLSMGDRDYALTSYGVYADYCFGDHNKTLVEEAFLAYFRSNNWYGGFSAFLNHAEDVLKTAQAHSLTPEQEDQSFHGLTYSGDVYRYGVTGKLPVVAKVAISLGAPSMIALLICSIFRAQMKTAKQRTTAEEYVVPGSAALRIKEDRFINRTQTRVPIQTSSGSGRGGGGGGGGFHTHTGKF